MFSSYVESYDKVSLPKVLGGGRRCLPYGPGFKHQLMLPDVTG